MQTLSSSPCGLAALTGELLQFLRILSRTALQLWILKTSTETPILRRRRIAAAEADAKLDPNHEAMHPDSD